MPYIKLLFITIFFLIPSIALADIKYLNWREKIKLTDEGKKVEIKIRGRIENLKPHYYHSSFSFIFAPEQKIKITKVFFNNKIAKYQFQNNQLIVQFNESKINGDYINVDFTYQETYDKIYHDLRQEFIYVPKWAAGALSKVIIDYPGSMDVATYDPHIKQSNDRFIFEGRVPKDGIQKIIKLTPSKKVWNVTINNSIRSDKILTNLELTVPTHFKESGQKSYNYRTSSNVKEDRHQPKIGSDIFHYKNSKSKEIHIKTQATIYTGKKYRTSVIRNPSLHMDVNQKDRVTLHDILHKIRSMPNPDNLPLYAKIGHFVHNYIKYDISYVGKRLSIQDIVRSKTGVCVEYSTLYNTLARMAGIPSVIVSGAARGEYGKFEPHSWNLTLHNNKWIYVDPTWNLMSGVVSASHIYFYDGQTRAISARGRGNWGNVQLDTSFEIEEML